MSDLFVKRGNRYNPRNFQALEISHKRTVVFGTETISYRGPQIWNLILEKLRTLSTLKLSKMKVSCLPLWNMQNIH